MGLVRSLVMVCCVLVAACDGTPMAMGAAEVASITVSPTTAALAPGESLGFTAVAHDTTGAVVGASIAWTSSDDAIATVASDGIVTAHTAGTSTIRATSGDVVGEATVEVRVPMPGTFTHEPAGWSVLGEWNNGAALDAGSFYADGNPSGFGEKSRVITGYAGTPTIGGAAAIQTFYAGGTDGGHDAGRMQLDLPSGVRELFFGAELQFAADYPTSTSSGGNKQLFVTFADGGRYFINLDEGMAAGRWGIYQQSSPLADSAIDVAYGRWITVEWYLRGDTGASDGILRLWIDGALALDLTNLTFPTGEMVLAYDDGSNNGNHYPTESDPRRIGSSLGGPVDAYRWASVLRVSAPP